MSLVVILWLATGAGAIAFFLAGLVLGRARARALHTSLEASRPAAEPAPPPAATVAAPAPAAVPPAPASQPSLGRPAPAADAPNEGLAAARTEAEHLRGELTRTRAENARVEKERERLRGELEQQTQALEAARVQNTAAQAKVTAAQAQITAAQESARTSQAERSRLESELGKLRGTEADLRAQIDRARSEGGAVQATQQQLERKTHELQKALEELRLERTRGQEREYQLERQVKAIDPEVEKTLRHDLGVVRELLRTQEEKARRLDETNIELRRDLEAAGGRAARLESLERENQELRVRALASDLSPQGQQGDKRPASAIANAHALQVLVGQVASIESVRAAVIGDDLGLVVACQGIHAEELAAIGALLGRACTEARKVLPLDRIARVILEDEGNISVTVRPLQSYDSRAAEDELTLVTLAYGAEPDPGQVALILGQQGSLQERPARDGRDAHDAQQVGT